MFIVYFDDFIYLLKEKRRKNVEIFFIVFVGDFCVFIFYYNLEFDEDDNIDYEWFCL